jgi:hypothetical protein
METIENINVEITPPPPTTTPTTTPPQTHTPTQTPSQVPELLNIEVKDQITALNVLINYITIAQKRGIFSIQESAHIWSCIQLFISQGSSPSTIDVNEKKKSMNYTS